MTRVLVSVGNAVVRDTTTGACLMYGKANIDSAFTLSATNTEVRGGINNALLFNYIHDKKVDVKITDATFNMDILALNAGTNVLSSSVYAVATECVNFSASGSATLAHTPAGTTTNVTVFIGDPPTIQTVTPVGSVITVSGGNSLQGTAFYTYATTADQLTIEGVTPPQIVDLTLIAEERDSVTKTVVNNVHIHIPQFQVLGNYTLAMAANGVSNQPLEGTALLVKSTTCDVNDYYATVTRISATSSNPVVSNLYLSKDTSFSVAAGLPKSIQLQTLGLRGGLQGNIDVTTSASYHVTSGSTTLAAYYNVGANTGLVVAGSSVAAGWIAVVSACYVDATSGTLTDTATITATA
jgi:hypothetical protein